MGRRGLQNPGSIALSWLNLASARLLRYYNYYRVHTDFLSKNGSTARKRNVLAGVCGGQFSIFFQKKKVGSGFLPCCKKIPIPATIVRGRSPVWVGVVVGGAIAGIRVAETWAVWPAVTCWVACQS